MDGHKQGDEGLLDCCAPIPSSCPPGCLLKWPGRQGREGGNSCGGATAGGEITGWGQQLNASIEEANPFGLCSSTKHHKAIQSDSNFMCS